MVANDSDSDAHPKSRVLVVDDDPMIRDVVVESIRLGGQDADFCEDGLEALEIVRNESYELIVTDMRLPGMDGLSLIKRLQTDGVDVDVIVITGYATTENAVECMKAGALDYLIKPFTVSQIQLAVAKALDHRELRKRAKEREFYRELSYVDSLTGVYNRRYFDEILEKELIKACAMRTSVVLLMIDIDDFKIYNDENGHPQGDEALTQLGRILKSACRGYDIVTRYGGEEFAIIFPGANKAHATELAERILMEVRAYPFEGEHRLPSGRLTVSIGVACFPWDTDNAQDLVQCSDSALYEAKKAGKNNVWLYGSS
ncbi:diguanylate cyclase [Thermodesulfobacteriota bacterium]